MLLSVAICLAFVCALGAGMKTPREQEDERDDLWFHFVTRPDIQAPKFNVTIYDEESLSPGYWFISPYEDADKQDRSMPWVGPYIYDGYGDLIWAGTPLMDHFQLWDFKVSLINNNPTLSGLWQRDHIGIILNSHYEIIRRVPINLWNMHEFNIIDNGRRVLVATKEERYPLSLETSRTIGFDGRCKVTADGFQDIDISVEPPRVMFEWRGIDHMDLEEAVMRPEKVEKLCSHNWDINHFNAIDLMPDGDYLISSRHTSTIYKVSHKDGSIVWRLGGKQSNFTLPPSAQFTRQHNARYLSQNSTHTLISPLDNAYGWTDSTRHGQSRGLVLALSTATNSVSVVQKAQSPIHTISESRGSNQRLPNNNLFVCWVDRTRLSEHGPDGRLLMHAHAKTKFEAHVDSYRAYKFPWVGRPKSPPDVYAGAFVAGEDTTTIVYVSWNGATEVAKWRLYSSSAEGRKVEHLKQKKREGFETRIMFPEFVEFVVVESLDREDQPIGRSRVVRTIPPVEEEMGVEGAWLVDVLMSPVSTFIIGFLAAVAICVVTWFVFGSRGLRWKRSGDQKYEAVDRDERDEVLFGAGDEDDVDEDIELRDKT